MELAHQKVSFCILSFLFGANRNGSYQKMAYHRTNPLESYTVPVTLNQLITMGMVL